MMLQMHRSLLNYLGLKNYKAKLPVLLFKKKIIEGEHYVVCCSGSLKIEIENKTLVLIMRNVRSELI